MKIVTVVGARPQFIKAAAISRVIASMRPAVDEILVHTGQHFDSNMSGVFFSEMGIAAPVHNFGVAGGTHGSMTARMLEAVEKVLIEEGPDWVLVYGDTNSTLAAALAASKLSIPIAHVEAGLRSFNRQMPEEINRVIADHVSAMLLCPTTTAVRNLKNEGVHGKVHLVGDVMYDVSRHFAHVAEEKSKILASLDLEPGRYVLATCHRAENTDDPRNLHQILKGLETLADTIGVVFPIHPRTERKVREYGFGDCLKKLCVTQPVSYLDMVMLEKNACAIVTDSGGVQKEAFFYRVPCITVRNETEWVETVESGWNAVVGALADRMVKAFETLTGSGNRTDVQPYGDGHAAERIIELLLNERDVAS